MYIGTYTKRIKWMTFFFGLLTSIYNIIYFLVYCIRSTMMIPIWRYNLFIYRKTLSLIGTQVLHNTFTLYSPNLWSDRNMAVCAQCTRKITSIIYGYIMIIKYYACIRLTDSYCIGVIKQIILWPYTSTS